MTETQSNSGQSFVGNVAFNLLSLVAPLLFAFFATPILVQSLGVEEYGYYSLVLAVIGFGFTTGIGRIPAKYVPERRAADEKGELRALLSSAVSITLAVAVIEGGILALASPFLISKILGVADGAADQLKSAIYLASLIGVAMMLSQVFQSTLQGVHRFRVFSFITVATSFLLNLGSVLMAANGFPYSDIFIWNLLVTSAAALAFLTFAKSVVPELAFPTSINREALTRVGWFAGSIFIYQSITSIFYLFERSYILRNYGPEALTYYTIPLMLGIYLHGLILAISQVTIPKFNERNKNEKALSDLYSTLTKLVLSGSIFLALIYYCLGGQLLALWLGPDFASRSSWLLAIDGLAFALIAILIPAWILSESVRKPGINASSPTVTYVVGIAAIVILGSAYGTQGVAAGRLVGAIAALPIIPIVERLVFGKIMWVMWAGVVLRVLTASIVILLLDILLTARFGTSWWVLTFSFLLFSLAFWSTLFVSRLFSRSELRSALTVTPFDDQDSEIIDAVQ